MEKIEIRENKIPLIVGGICSGVFILFLFFSVIMQDDIVGIMICVTVFGGFSFLGITLVCSYFLRKLVITERECFYQTTYGRRKVFMFQDIGKCVFHLKNVDSQYKLYNREGEYLARFEDNMVGSAHLLSLLKEKGILFEKNTKLNYLEKISQGPDEKSQQEEIENIKELYDQEKLIRIKKILRIIQSVNVVILLIAFFLFSKRNEMIVFMLTPLFWYIVYLYVYPVMVIEINTKTKRKWKNVHIEMPWVPVGLSIVVLALGSNISNIQDDTKLVTFIVIFTTLLFSAFVYIGYKRERCIKKRKWLSVYFALLVYAFSSSYAWNWVCRIEAPVHEKVVVIDKQISHSKYSNDYTLEVRLHDGTI
ncbi:MAG: DUF6560 family protein, partial [Coprobacillus sp.]